MINSELGTTEELLERLLSSENDLRREYELRYRRSPTQEPGVLVKVIGSYDKDMLGEYILDANSRAEQSAPGTMYVVRRRLLLETPWHDVYTVST